MIACIVTMSRKAVVTKKVMTKKVMTKKSMLRKNVATLHISQNESQLYDCPKPAELNVLRQLSDKGISG